jgi:hypothetical protein
MDRKSTKDIHDPQIPKEMQKLFLPKNQTSAIKEDMMTSTISESPLQGGGAPLPSKPSCIGDFDFSNSLP